MPPVSVVMAAYNAETYISAAVTSILNQSYSNFELIVVNDGSTDRTGSMLDAITDHRVTVIHSAANRGAAASLNRAIACAKGEWIAIHDADDMSTPNRLEAQVKQLQATPNSVGTGAFISCLLEEPSSRSEERYYNQVFDKGKIMEHRLFMCYLCHGTVMFSKAAFHKVGGYDPRYKISYDYDLWLRLFDIAPIEKTPQVLYYYRIRNNSLGKINRRETITELMEISSSYVYKKVLCHTKKTTPHLTVIGSEKGCRFFKEHVRKPSQWIRYVSDRKDSELLKVCQAYQKGATEAILVLNDSMSSGIIHYFKKFGLRLNKEVYKIWNYRY